MDKERRLGKRHQLPAVRAKVFVATPAYDGKVDTDYAMSLAESCMHATHVGIGVQASVMGNGAFIEMARNIFVKAFLQTDCTHLFFIDSDLKWESRAFVGLIESDRDVCAGLYRRRQEPEDYPVRYCEDKDNPGIQVVDGGWVECDRVPTGFLLIKRHVLEAMVEKADKLTISGQGEVPWVFETRKIVTDQGNTTFMGEDFSWCDDYREQFGKPIHVWPDFEFTHGGYKCNWHRFMNAQVEAAGEKPINLVRVAS